MIDFRTLVQRLRMRLPASVKRMLRLLKASMSPPVYSPTIPEVLFENARFVASREQLISLLPHGKRVVELGTYKGDFARSILDRCAPSQLDIIDRDMSVLRGDVANDPCVRLHCGVSWEEVERLAPGPIAWIYIDAGHSYEEVIADTRAAAKRVQPGGYLVFNDFAYLDLDYGQYGVHRAVSEFLVSERWKIFALAYQNGGLYDIAIQAPME